MNSLFSSISAQDLRRAAEIKEKIDSLQDELARILGSDSVASEWHTAPTRTMSVAARKRIAAGARARWAKVRRGSDPVTNKSRKKRSTAVRARLAEVARERWKRAKAAGRSTL